MKVSIEKPHGGAYTHEDVTYYFCGSGCNRAFQMEPEEYLSGRKKIDTRTGPRVLIKDWATSDSDSIQSFREGPKSLLGMAAAGFLEYHTLP